MAALSELLVAYSRLSDEVQIVEIARLTGFSVSTVSKHLNDLAARGIIEWEPRRGRGVRSRVGIPRAIAKTPVEPEVIRGEKTPGPSRARVQTSTEEKRRLRRRSAPARANAAAQEEPPGFAEAVDGLRLATGQRRDALAAFAANPEGLRAAIAHARRHGDRPEALLSEILQSWGAQGFVGLPPIFEPTDELAARRIARRLGPDGRRITGCRQVRGTGLGHRYDPLGTDRPPQGWPHDPPTEEEIAAALDQRAEGSLEPTRATAPDRDEEVVAAPEEARRHLEALRAGIFQAGA